MVINEKLEHAVRRVRADLPVHRLEDPPLVAAVSDLDRDAAKKLRSDLNLGDRPVALYTGNFEPYQGVEQLVAAALRLEGVAFVFVGGEVDDIARLRASVPAQHASRILFVGKKPTEMLPRFMALADVLVSPRATGGNTPFKIYTYLASSKPIVATRLDTHTQVLSDETAFLVDATDEGIANGIEAALTNRGESARRAANGASLLEREYSAARYRQKVEAAYAILKR